MSTKEDLLDRVKTAIDSLNTLVISLQATFFKLDGSRAMSGNLDMDGNNIVNVSELQDVSEIQGDDDITINSGSNKTLLLDKIVWDDIRIVPGAFTFLGNSDPTLEDWQPGGAGTTFQVYKFLKNDEVFASCQMPHGYKEGTDLEFHLHWTPCDRGNEENGNAVGWKVDYTMANPNGVFLSSATVDLSDVCNGVDDTHELTASVTVSGTGLSISHIIMLRIYRSDTGADDTWVSILAAQSPALLEFDIHFQKDTIGSRQELTK